MSSLVVDRQNNSIIAPARDFEVKYNCKVRYFPDNQIKITCFSKPIFNPLKVESINSKKLKILPNKNECDDMAYKFVKGWVIYNPISKTYQPIEKTKYKASGRIRNDSIKRAVDKAFEIGLSNDFQYFVTLTLDKEKINRYDKDLIYKKLKVWLSNKVQRNNMDYILFPEYHKLEYGQTECAIHFHCLVNANNLDLEDSGHETESGQTIYNLRGWKYGFSTVIKLNGSSAIVRYVTKYITKGNEKILGKYYLSGGKTLKREVPAEYLDLDYSTFTGQEYTIPNAGMSVKYKTFNLDFDINRGDQS